MVSSSCYYILFPSCITSSQLLTVKHTSCTAQLLHGELRLSIHLAYTGRRDSNDVAAQIGDFRWALLLCQAYPIVRAIETRFLIRSANDFFDDGRPRHDVSLKSKACFILRERSSSDRTARLFDTSSRDWASVSLFGWVSCEEVVTNPELLL